MFKSAAYEKLAGGTHKEEPNSKFPSSQRVVCLSNNQSGWIATDPDHVNQKIANDWHDKASNQLKHNQANFVRNGIPLYFLLTE